MKTWYAIKAENVDVYINSPAATKAKAMADLILQQMENME